MKLFLPSMCPFKANHQPIEELQESLNSISLHFTIQRGEAYQRQVAVMYLGKILEIADTKSSSHHPSTCTALLSAVPKTDPLGKANAFCWKECPIRPTPSGCPLDQVRPAAVCGRRTALANIASEGQAEHRWPVISPSD